MQHCAPGNSASMPHRCPVVYSPYKEEVGGSSLPAYGENLAPRRLVAKVARWNTDKHYLSDSVTPTCESCRHHTSARTTRGIFPTRRRVLREANRLRRSPGHCSLRYGGRPRRSDLRGADIRVVAQGSAPRQGLRAEGADQRGAHRGGDDPANAQAASESSVKNQSAGIMMP